MDIGHLLQRKSRGVTPVIATILLIGLVVVAGIAVAVVVFGTVNSPAPIEVEILGISEFETTDSNVLIDQFSVNIRNVERSTIRIESNAFTLEYFNSTLIEGWKMDPDKAIYLSPREIRKVELTCDPLIGDQLVPAQDAIYITVKVFPQDSTSERSAQTFRSDLLIIEDTYGPVFLDYLPKTTVLEATGLELNFTIVNNGSADQDFELELYTDSPKNISFIIQGINQTTMSFSLAGFSTVILNCTILPTALANVDDHYLVSVLLWNQESLGLSAIKSFALDYQG